MIRSVADEPGRLVARRHTVPRRHLGARLQAPHTRAAHARRHLPEWHVPCACLPTSPDPRFLRMPVAKHSAGRNELPDEGLMARYADGDTEAFGELFRRYEPRAYSFFLKRTGSTERAEDLYQDLFLRIHRSRDSYDSTRPFSPWFFRIAQRLWVDDLRRAFRSHEVPLDPRDLQSKSPSIERVLADRDDLGEALDALSPEERYVLVSFKVDGREYSELAGRLGKSVEAVKKMASRAMQRIGSAQRSDLARPVKR